MTVRRRRSDRSGRSKLHSPGRPDSARREELVRFWAAIATGRSSEDAARDAGVSPPVGSRWFRRSGGMPPSHLSQSAKPLSGRYLSFEEREEIALLRAQERGIRHIACRLERAPSTISREVRRNAATRSGGLDYRATTAQWHADRSAKRPKPAKLATNEALRRYVQDRLAGRISAPDGTVIEGPRVVWNGRRHGPWQRRRWARAWSPEQIARLCCKLGEGAMRDQGASCSPYDSALARRSCSHAMASVRAHGPRPKARSTIRASPTMPPWRANIPAWPLRSARITSKPLIVA